MKISDYSNAELSQILTKDDLSQAVELDVRREQAKRHSSNGEINNNSAIENIRAGIKARMNGEHKLWNNPDLKDNEELSSRENIKAGLDARSKQ